MHAHSCFSLRHNRNALPCLPPYTLSDTRLLCHVGGPTMGTSSQSCSAPVDRGVGEHNHCQPDSRCAAPCRSTPQVTHSIWPRHGLACMTGRALHHAPYCLPCAYLFPANRIHTALAVSHTLGSTPLSTGYQPPLPTVGLLSTSTDISRLSMDSQHPNIVHKVFARLI